MTSLPYPAGPPPKYRPRKRWWFVGASMIVLAVVTFVGGLWFLLSPLAREDAVITANQGPVEVDLPAGEQRALYTRDTDDAVGGEEVECTGVDAEGVEIDLRPTNGTFTYDEWTTDTRFETGAGDVTLDCTGPDGAEVRVGETPSTAAFVGGLLVTVLVPLVLGFGGVAVLVVTGILHGLRPPRPT